MDSLLEFRGVRIWFGDEVALDGIDLSVQCGQLLALIGPNGSGKTTLLRAAAGVLEPSSGTLRIASHDVTRDNLEAKRLLGFAVEPSMLPDLLSGRECLEMFASARGLAEVPAQTLALCQSLALTDALDRYVETYSLGTRQKLGIVLGTVGEPPLLLLDESFNGLDPLSSSVLKRYLAERVTSGAAGVVLSTHNLALAERFATRVALLLNGRLCQLWDSAELSALRADPEQSLEAALVRACGT